MAISIVDFLIVIFIILGGIVGYKNGFIREGIHFVGIIIISLISFYLKDILMVLLYKNLPFFNFFGMIRNITAINILFYQLLSFIIIFGALIFVLRIILVITGLIEWLVKLTVFLKFSSKILGIVVGILEFYVYIFIVLFILNMPIFHLKYVANSQFGEKVLNNTPILSNFVDNTVQAYSDIWTILKNDNEKQTDTETNTLVLATLLEHKLITIENTRKLVDSNKINITDKSLLDAYQDDSNYYDYVKQEIIKNKS